MEYLMNKLLLLKYVQYKIELKILIDTFINYTH